MYRRRHGEVSGSAEAIGPDGIVSGLDTRGPSPAGRQGESRETGAKATPLRAVAGGVGLNPLDLDMRNSLLQWACRELTRTIAFWSRTRAGRGWESRRA